MLSGQVSLETGNQCSPLPTSKPLMHLLASPMSSSDRFGAGLAGISRGDHLVAQFAIGAYEDDQKS